MTTIDPAAQALIDAVVAFRLNESRETAGAVANIYIDTLPNPMPGGWERAAMDARLDAHALLAGPDEAGSWAFLASRRPQPGDEVVWIWPMEPIMMGLKGTVAAVVVDELHRTGRPNVTESSLIVHWNGAEEESHGVKYWMVAVVKRASASKQSTNPTGPSTFDGGGQGQIEVSPMSAAQDKKDDAAEAAKAEKAAKAKTKKIDPRVPEAFHGSTQDFVDGYVARLDFKGDDAKAFGESQDESADWKAGWHKANKVSFGGK